jgi:hypothetical protein
MSVHNDDEIIEQEAIAHAFAQLSLRELALELDAMLEVAQRNPLLPASVRDALGTMSLLMLRMVDEIERLKKDAGR